LLAPAAALFAVVFAVFGAADFAAGAFAGAETVVFAALGTLAALAFAGALAAAVLAAGAFTVAAAAVFRDVALDFAAAFGLEAADAAFGAAVLLDGVLAMFSPIPRMLRLLATERTPARASIRDHSHV